MAGGRIDRRGLLGAGIVLPLGAHGGGAAAASLDGEDEAFWRGIAKEYDVTDKVIQVENGNWGMMPRSVLQAYEEQVRRVNRDTSFYTRRTMAPDWMAARASVAGAMGVPVEEMAFTRNATEALKALILGYNRLKPGDAVLYADLDYDGMQACMESLGSRRGVRVVRIALPEPATKQGLIDAYAEAFAAHPAIRMVLLTRVSHRTGLAIPVREIAALARAKGIDAIVDAAHSWYQVDGDIASLECDFVAVNCHKWLGAPLGVGAIHIRKTALDRIDPDPANDGASGIAARVHTGTSDFAAILTAPEAVAFHARIGAARREARLRALRDRWVSQVRGIERVQVLTPDDPELHGAITSFRLAGVTSVADNARLAARLLERHAIFTVHRTGVAQGACVRVTPALFNDMAQMDAVAAAIAEVARTFDA